MKMKSLLLMKEFLIKQKTIIQLNRIQQVNINQSLIQRLGVYELDVDTAGSAKKEGQMALSHPAIVLKARLLDNEKKESSSCTWKTTWL
jgi:putative membrane protein